MTRTHDPRRGAHPPERAGARVAARPVPAIRTSVEVAATKSDRVPPMVFAALHAKLGNAAVARLAARLRRAPPPGGRRPAFAPMLPGLAPTLRLDRKVGFEVETLVPILPAPGATGTLKAHPSGMAPSPALEHFLYGGGQQVQYADDAGKVAGVFDVSADHAAAIYQPVNDIIAHLVAVGLSAVTPLGGDKRMSMIEYGTAAYEELKAGSNARFQAQFDALKNHLTASAATAKGKKLATLPAPAAAFYTGIPYYEFMAWLKPPPMGRAERRRYRKSKAFRQKWDAWNTIGPLLDELQTNVEQDKTGQLQSTVGIVPSALTKLFDNYLQAQIIGRNRKAPSPLAAGAPVKAEVDDLLQSAAWQNAKYVKRLKRKSGKSYRALEGTIHLLYTYLAGAPLNAFIRSNIKNTVPFLIKLADFGAIISQASPSYLRAHPPDAATILVVKNHVVNSGIDTVAYWKATLNKKPHRAPGGNPADLIDKMLSGQTVAAGFGPGATFKKPEAVGRGQTGVQVEYRHMPDRPAAAGLDNVLWKVVDEVRDLNMDGYSALSKWWRRRQF